MNKVKKYNGIFLICISLAIIFALLFIGVNCIFAVGRMDYIYAVKGPNEKYDIFIAITSITSYIFMALSIILAIIGVIFKVKSFKYNED